METLKVQHEERVSMMLSSSEARETELRTQVKDLQTRLNEKENLLSSAEAEKTELQTQLAFKAELLSEKEDMS
jgi:hypothetical protein